MINNAPPATHTWHWIIAAIAVVVAAFALGRMVYTRRFLRSASSAQGTVVDVRPKFLTGVRSRATGGLVWYPTVEYTTATGERVRYTETTGSGPAKPAEVGETVEVRYDPARPQRAMMAAKAGRDVKGLTFFAVFVLLVAVVSAVTA